VLATQPLQLIYIHIQKQVQNVLWTRKAPTCLLTLLYAYGKPRLCINIHHYAPPATVHRAAASAAPHIVLQQAAAVLHALCRQYTSEGSMSSFKSITLNELHSEK